MRAVVSLISLLIIVIVVVVVVVIIFIFIQLRILARVQLGNVLVDDGLK